MLIQVVGPVELQHLPEPRAALALPGRQGDIGRVIPNAPWLSGGRVLRCSPVRGAEVGVPPEVELVGDVHGRREIPGGVDELGRTGGEKGSG